MSKPNGQVRTCSRSSSVEASASSSRTLPDNATPAWATQGIVVVQWLAAAAAAELKLR